MPCGDFPYWYPSVPTYTQSHTGPYCSGGLAGPADPNAPLAAAMHRLAAAIEKLAEAKA